MNSRETQEASGKSQVPNRTLAKRISAIVQTKLFKNLQSLEQSSPDSGCLGDPEPKRRRLSEDPNKYLPTTACASTNTDSLYSPRSTQKRKSEDLLNATTSKSPEDAVNRVSFNLKSSLRSEDDTKRKETYVDHNRTPGSPFYPGNTTYGGENWECHVCHVRNDKRNSKCVCCQVEKPGKKKPEITFNMCLPTTTFILGSSFNTINIGPMKSVNFKFGNKINSTNVLNFGGPSGKCESLTIDSQGNIRSAGDKINENIILSGNNSINIFQGSNKGCNSLINLGSNLNTINFGPMKSVNFEIGNNINSTNVLNFGGPSGKCESLTIVSQGNITSAGNIISSGNNSITTFQRSNKKQT
ncbi:uncharacterized protein LOC125053633 isoform X2 [Pieris napi]|uniref:uncharacterized protein LOC125053633 isoform X2 n=1 Tax=Pieris napi TaxID=78633 RepID=UPI001FBC0FE4|nr:uncharacterized protein LOC125053633 isoform X2 [Pieris napi]